MSKMKEEFSQQPDVPDDSDYNAPDPWQFIGQVNCDKCKFFRVCKAGESNCPYLAGWKDGQKKLLKWLDDPCNNKEHNTNLFNDNDKTKVIFWHRYHCPRCIEKLVEGINGA